jgi:hypothetical protein
MPNRIKSVLNFKKDLPCGHKDGFMINKLWGISKKPETCFQKLPGGKIFER